MLDLIVTLGYHFCNHRSVSMPTEHQPQQTFVDLGAEGWQSLPGLSGVLLLPLAVPAPGGSIHRARLDAGTVIPPHTHPADEYVWVVAGTIETGGRRCEAGTFWRTPGGVRQGPHHALTATELLTVRLGPLGVFDAAV
jgi:anti-sigma factor ChrR (cupin superfamily)